MDWVAIIGGIVIGYLLYSIYKAWQDSRAPAPAPAKWMVGDITLHTLATHNGYDWSKPTLIAVKGVVYDVSKSNDEYGPGACLTRRPMSFAPFVINEHIKSVLYQDAVKHCPLWVQQLLSPMLLLRLQASSTMCMLAGSAPGRWPRTLWK